MPLKGIKVIELAGLAPGPFCGMILAEFGASVIRVDKISSQAELPDVLGHGKRSITINLKTKEGTNIFKKLCNKSDILIDPFRRGVMERLNLGPKNLMDMNKRLIYARLTGFGQNGIYANMAGHDINYIALSGLLSLLGRYNEKPTPPINFAADFCGGGLICAFGILLALFDRHNTNMGQIIDASMSEGTAYLSSWFYRSQKLFWLWGNPRGKNIIDTGTHFYDTYETKDNRYMAVGAIEPKFYTILLEKLNLSKDELPHYTDFEKNKTILTEIFKTKTQKEWCNIFIGCDACVTPVLNLQDVALDEHNKENKTFTILEDETVVPNPAPKLSRTPGSSMANFINPKIGEHTLEILLELKYTSDEIANFISTGIVKQATRRAHL